MNQGIQVVLIIFTSVMIGCSGIKSLKEGTVFEVGNYYGVHGEGGIAIYSKDNNSSVSLYPGTASIEVGDKVFVVGHQDGQYQKHVIRQLNNEGVFNESGKAIILFAD